eukprot:Rhum_TRINITY_DN13177_c2_g1::Rhum_TRINITY_DN13177_c2_g1_i1::g.57626::m.57626
MKPLCGNSLTRVILAAAVGISCCLGSLLVWGGGRSLGACAEAKPSPEPTVAADASATVAASGAAGLGATDVNVEPSPPQAYRGFQPGMPGCIVRKPGRAHSTLEKPTPRDVVSSETVYFADDGCALGHLVKDAAGVVSHILARARAPETRAIDAIVFSHPCADPGTGGPLFRDVILPWFEAAAAVAAARSGRRLRLAYARSTPARMCAASLLTRGGWRWFADAASADAFRGALRAAHGIPAVAAAAAPQGRPLVTVLRRERGRRFGEADVARYLAERLGIADVRLVSFDGSALPYAAQLQALAATDVLVAAHGAALASIVVMTPGAAVVELFPHNFKYLMYEELARVSGLLYFPHEARDEVHGGCKRCRPRTHNASLPSTSSADAKAALLRHMNGAKACKNCDIALPLADAYLLTRDALMSVMLLRVRQSSNVLDVDRRF